MNRIEVSWSRVKRSCRIPTEEESTIVEAVAEVQGVPLSIMASIDIFFASQSTRNWNHRWLMRRQVWETSATKWNWRLERRQVWVTVEGKQDERRTTCYITSKLQEPFDAMVSFYLKTTSDDHSTQHLAASHIRFSHQIITALPTSLQCSVTCIRDWDSDQMSCDFQN